MLKVIENKKITIKKKFDRFLIEFFIDSRNFRSLKISESGRGRKKYTTLL